MTTAEIAEYLKSQHGLHISAGNDSHVIVCCQGWPFLIISDRDGISGSYLRWNDKVDVVEEYPLSTYAVTRGLTSPSKDEKAFLDLWISIFKTVANRLDLAAPSTLISDYQGSLYPRRDIAKDQIDVCGRGPS